MELIINNNKYDSNQNELKNIDNEDIKQGLRIVLPDTKKMI